MIPIRFADFGCFRAGRRHDVGISDRDGRLRVHPIRRIRRKVRLAGTAGSCPERISGTRAEECAVAACSAGGKEIVRRGFQLCASCIRSGFRIAVRMKRGCRRLVGQPLLHRRQCAQRSVCGFFLFFRFIAQLMMSGMERNTAVPITTSHVYMAGLPTGSCEGGKTLRRTRRGPPESRCRPRPTSPPCRPERGSCAADRAASSAV